MSKKRKTVTLDPEVAAYLDVEGRNASETVNRLVRIDMGEEAVNDQILEMRMEMQRDRYEEAASKAKNHLKRYNQLKERLEKARSKKSGLFEEAKDALAEVPKKTDNPAVQNWAQKLGMTPSELIQELEGDDD